MRKLTFKYKAIPDTLKGYAEVCPPTESEILDFICEQGIKERIYSHNFRAEYENVSDTNFEYFYWGRCATEESHDYKIPYSDLVYYIDCYVQ